MAFKRRGLKKKYVPRRIKNKSKYRKATWKVNPYNMPVRYFKRKVNLGTVTTNVGGYVGALQTFNLALLPNYNELTVLFDQYSIRYVNFYVVMRPTTLSMIESHNNLAMGMPNIAIVKDYDSSTPPTSDENGYNQIREYSSSKTFSFTAERRAFKIGICPAVLTEVYRSGISTAYSPKFKQFIDCTTPDVPHFGLPYVIRVPSSSAVSTLPITFDIYATFYVAMRTIR